ncbi:MAG: hypothetical protein PWP28_1979 [Oceanotoga sp.]|nr:hypothetical protein [Oceanotoga sp.]
MILYTSEIDEAERSAAGSAPVLGTGGRWFDPSRSDHICGSSSIGRVSAFQAEGCEFDSRLPLQRP